MAIEKIINVKVAGTNQIVQIEQAVEKTNQATGKLTKSQKDLESTINSGSKNSIANTNKLATATDRATASIKEEKEATKELNEVKEESAEISADTLDLMGKLDSATGGAIGQFRELQGGLKTGIGLFKNLKLAIASTGIGLLLIAFSALVSYFQASEEGQDKLARIMNVFGSIVGNITDKISDLGGVIMWAFENPKKAIKELGDFIKENIENRIVGMLTLLPKLGESISLVFKGEFKEAGKVAVNAMGQIVSGQKDIIGKFGEMRNASKTFMNELKADALEAVRISKMREEAGLMDRNLMIEQAKANLKISELRDKAVQKDIYSAKQREAFLMEAYATEEDIQKKQIASLALKRDAIIAENELSKSNKEALDAEAKAIADVIIAEGALVDSKRRLQTQIQGARREEAQRIKAINEEQARERKEAADKEIADRQKQIDDLLTIEQNAIKSREDLLAKTEQQRLDLEKERQLKALEQIKLNEEEKINALIAINELFDLKQKEINEAKEKEAQEKAIEDKYKMLEDLQLTEEQRLKIITEIDDLILESNQLTEKERTALYDKQTKARIKIAEKEAENKSKLNSAIAQGAEAVSGIIGKQTAVGKTLAAASSLINSYASIAGQLKAFSGVPIPGYAIAQAVATGLVGFASVKDILSVKVPNSGGSDSGLGGMAPSAPAVNLVGATDSNQIAETINSQTDQQNENANKPIRAYVVTKDISTQQELERNASDSSSF